MRICCEVAGDSTVLCEAPYPVAHFIVEDVRAGDVEVDLSVAGNGLSAESPDD